VDAELQRFLLDRGASVEQVRAAEAEGWLTLLAIDRSLFTHRAEYTRADIADLAGVDPEISVRLWRALGFPDVPDGVPVFTGESVDVLRALQTRVQAWFQRRESSEDDAVEALIQQVRALSGGFARVAEVLSDSIVDSVAAAREQGLTDDTIAHMYTEFLQWPAVLALFDYVLRLQLRDAVWRKLAVDDPHSTQHALAVGFFDLVGYTALSQELEEDELGRLVERFEALTHDTIAQLGGRVVKTIGDEVMFVSELPELAGAIALRLTEQTTDDTLLPNARCGLAYGQVVAREGDYYGPVVNLAHRLVEVAYPGTVLASDELHGAIAEDPTFQWGRSKDRKIRDIGRVPTWPLRAAGNGEPAR
jgi:adenylate cyclase